jgi:hypothetical protein
MKLRVEGVELEAKLPPESAAADVARPVLVLEDGRTLGALDAVVRGVELISATSEELRALLEAGYVLTGTGRRHRPPLPSSRGEPVGRETVTECPHGNLVSSGDICWAAEWRSKDGEASLWVGSGATAEEALAEGRAKCYSLEIESGGLVVHQLKEETE